MDIIDEENMTPLQEYIWERCEMDCYKTAEILIYTHKIIKGELLKEKHNPPDAQDYCDMGADRQYELDIELGENQGVDKAIEVLRELFLKGE